MSRVVGTPGIVPQSLAGVPSVITFALEQLADETIGITAWTVSTDATHVQTTESATPPALSDAGWVAVGSMPTTHTTTAAGAVTVYAWAKNPCQISEAKSATCALVIPGLVSSLDAGLGLTAVDALWPEQRPLGDSNAGWTDVSLDATGQYILAGANGGRLWASSDSGASWAEQRPLGDSNAGWNGVALDATGQNRLACVMDGRLWASSDSGANWAEQRPLGNNNADWTDVALDATGQNRLACVTGGRLWASSDSGANWAEQRPLGDSNASWNGVALDATGQNRLACVTGGRLWASSDSGANWAEQRPLGDSNASWHGVAFDATGQHRLACVLGGRIYDFASAVSALADQIGDGDLSQSTATLQMWAQIPEVCPGPESFGEGVAAVWQPSDALRTLVNSDVAFAELFDDAAAFSIIARIKKFTNPGAAAPLINAAGTGATLLGIGSDGRPYLTAGTTLTHDSALDTAAHCVTWSRAAGAGPAAAIYIDTDKTAGSLTPGTISPTSVTLGVRAMAVGVVHVSTQQLSDEHVAAIAAVVNP